MGYMNLGSSMRYGPSGKRRKTSAWSTKKKTPPVRTSMKPDQKTLDRMKAADSYKQEVSKNYTVAIGYNKGAYQVIPKNEIKSIGK